MQSKTGPTHPRQHNPIKAGCIEFSPDRPQGARVAQRFPRGAQRLWLMHQIEKIGSLDDFNV